jgi:histone arginine demethylase JMJD6
MIVERRRRLPLGEFLHDFMRRGQPVIIEDATDDWPAMAKWTPEHFRERFPDKEITVDGTAYRLADFVDVVLQGTDSSPAPYLSNLEIRRNFAELLPDVYPYLRYAFPNHMKDLLVGKVGWPRLADCVEFYLGGRGTRFSTLHFDNFYLHAFITQVYGEKEFLLVPPSDTERVYAGGPLPSGHQSKTMRVDSDVAYYSTIDDVFDPDLTRFPRFAEAVQARAVVSAPATVFIPAGWWHATRMTTPSIAVSTNSLNADNLAQFRRTYPAPRRETAYRVLFDRVGRPLVGPISRVAEYVAARQEA